jgi:hypothetical protein
MRLITFLLLITFSLAVNAEIYRWEYNGKVTYSDKKPHPNARRVKLRDVTTYKQRRIPRVPATTYTPPKDKKDRSKTYEVSVVSPVNNEALNKTSGDITVKFDVTPSLVSHAGHRIHYQIGNVSGATTELEVLAQNIHRGTHQITVQVRDAEGNALSPKSTSTVTILRPSILIKKKGMAPQAPKAK